MTEDRRRSLLESIRRFTQEDTQSPETAMATLIKEGIYTKDGHLAPQFGGEIEQQRNVAG